MDYFSLSPFYEKNSINQICAVQNIDFKSQRFRQTGIEFILDSVNRDKNLFIISKNNRRYQESVVLSFYYVFKGTIYQAPDVYSVITSNIESITNNFVNIVNELNKAS